MSKSNVFWTHPISFASQRISILAYNFAPVCRVTLAVLFLLQIYVSRKWGFTKWDRGDYEEMRQDGRLIPDGVGVQYKPGHGPLKAWFDRKAGTA